MKPITKQGLTNLAQEFISGISAYLGSTGDEKAPIKTWNCLIPGQDEEVEISFPFALSSGTCFVAQSADKDGDEIGLFIDADACEVVICTDDEPNTYPINEWRDAVQHFLSLR